MSLSHVLRRLPAARAIQEGDREGATAIYPDNQPSICLPPVINYAHFHAAITPHQTPLGLWNSQLSPVLYVFLHCNDHPIIHSPFKAMAAVKTLQLTPAFPHKKTLHVWPLGFSVAVNPRLLPINPSLLPCVV